MKFKEKDLVCIISNGLTYAPSETVGEEGFVKECFETGKGGIWRKKYVVTFPVAIRGYVDWIFEEDELSLSERVLYSTSTKGAKELSRRKVL